MKKNLKDEDLKKVDGGSTVITAFSQTLSNSNKKGSHTIGGNPLKSNTVKSSKVTVTKKSSKKK